MRRVEARVVLHLLRPARVLVTCLEQLAPLRVEAGVVLLDHLREEVGDRMHLLAQLLQLGVEVGSLRLALLARRLRLELKGELLHLQLRDLPVQLGSLVAQRGDLLLQVGRLLRGLDLAEELRHDEHRPPSEGALGAEYVGVHVVSHVHELRARAQLEQSVQMVPVAALEHLAISEHALGGLVGAHLDVHKGGVGRADLEEGEVRIEQEARLARAADGEVKVLEPIVAEEELADDLGVVVERVGEEEHLRPAEAELREHARELRRPLDVAPRVDCDRILDLAVTVAEVDGAADVSIDLGVRLRHRLRPGVLEVDQLAEETNVDQKELRVDRGVLGRRERRLRLELLRVESLAFVGAELGEAVVGDLDVLVPVQLEQVAPPLVDHQPALVLGVVVHKGRNLLGIAHRQKLAHGAVVGEDVEGLRDVLGERVVEIEADCLDLLHVQRAVAEDAPADVVGWVWHLGGLLRSRRRHAHLDMLPPSAHRCQARPQARRRAEDANEEAQDEHWRTWRHLGSPP
mmetsp:Transcript_12614/g.33531  ORF Transcript_12614/g.33531 Transcript_12614/m.33531 type:complete len:517 (+) Transcript_12614:544-2094(+)